jgi:hypothetical protein
MILACAVFSFLEARRKMAVAAELAAAGPGSPSKARDREEHAPLLFKEAAGSDDRALV